MLDLGLTSAEILEAIEITLPEAGVVAFQRGLEAWCEVVGATGIEPAAVLSAADADGPPGSPLSQNSSATDH